MLEIWKCFGKVQVISRYKLLENNLEPEPSYILVRLFKMSQKEYCFPDCWKDSSMVPVFENLRKDLQLKTTNLLVFFLSLVKSLKNLQIISLLIILRNMAFLFPLAFQAFLIKCRFSDSLYLLIGIGLCILISISSLMVVCVSGIQLIFPFSQL